MSDTLNKESFNEQIYSILKEDIISGKIAFNEMLTNRDLQKRFDVSSTPIRDAINRLYQDGLVENITKAGAKVMCFNRTRLLELNEMMMVINISAIEFAMLKGQNAALHKDLETAIKIQRDTELLPKYLEGDRKFHSAFFKYAHNEYLNKMFAQLNPLWLLLIRLYYDDESQKASASVVIHTQISEAIRDNDMAFAKECMREHFKMADKAINANFKD